MQALRSDCRETRRISRRLADMEMVPQYFLGSSLFVLIQHIQRPEMDICATPLPDRERRRPQIPYPPSTLSFNSHSLYTDIMDALYSRLGLHSGFAVLFIYCTSASERSNQGREVLLQEAGVGSAAAWRAGERDYRGR
jgi:hypothetical protein